MNKLGNNGHGKVTVLDQTGRAGEAFWDPGYLSGGSFVNPSWNIVWDALNDLDT